MSTWNDNSFVVCEKLEKKFGGSWNHDLCARSWYGRDAQGKQRRVIRIPVKRDDAARAGSGIGWVYQEVEYDASYNRIGDTFTFEEEETE